MSRLFQGESELAPSRGTSNVTELSTVARKVIPRWTISNYGCISGRREDILEGHTEAGMADFARFQTTLASVLATPISSLPPPASWMGLWPSPLSCIASTVNLSHVEDAADELDDTAVLGIVRCFDASEFSVDIDRRSMGKAVNMPESVVETPASFPLMYYSSSHNPPMTCSELCSFYSRRIMML